LADGRGVAKAVITSQRIREDRMRRSGPEVRPGGWKLPRGWSGLGADDGQTGSNAGTVEGSLRFLGFPANRSSITSLRLLVSRKLDSQSFAQWTKAARLEIVC
jgi:hypothetical protein